MSPYRRLSSPQRENRAIRNPVLPPLRRRTSFPNSPPSDTPVSADSPDRITVLATDIVASTPLGKRIGEDVFRRVLTAHHRLLRGQIAACQGRELKETGDGFLVAFSGVRESVLCAQSIQEAIEATNRTGGFAGHPLDLRMAIHIMDVTHEDGDYRGLGLHDLARLLSASNGGQVLLSELAATLLQPTLPSGISLVDCGRYLLRDAPGPVRLFEALWDGMPGGSVRPLPVAPPEREPRLPTTYTRFFGREAERERIARVLEGGARLVTLTGMGGSGKTRLAVETARHLAPRFGGAVWFVALDAVSDPNRILEAVRAVVGTSEGTTGEGFAGLDPMLSSGPCLLLLDNLEHLQAADDTAVDRFLQEALERYPSLILLCTSRHRLGLSLEQEIALRPFSLPSAFSGEKTVDADQVRALPSVALFEDRARHARSDFAVTDANADAVVKLCRRLEGLPLALELAAPWARMFTPAEMLARVSDIRRGRNRDLPERHRSLRAVMESSYQLLNAEQQCVFRALSVFRGGWTVEAAERVCDDPLALDLLADLSEHSLIVSEEGEEGVAERFTFLESVREFAASCLAANPEEAEVITQRHVAYFADLAQEADSHLNGANQVKWLLRLASEHHNLRLCLDHADLLTRLKMASHLYRYWSVRGYGKEALKILSLALNAPPEMPDSVVGRALQIAGALAMLDQDLINAEQLFLACQFRFQKSGDERNAALAMINLASVASKRGDFTAARSYYESSLPVWRQEGSIRTLALALTNMGANEAIQKNYAEAKAFHEEAYQIITTIEDKSLQSYILNNLGEVLVKMKDRSALSMLRECILLSLELCDNRILTSAVLNTAEMYSVQGKFPLSASLLQAAERISALTGASLPESEKTELLSVLLAKGCKRAMRESPLQIASLEEIYIFLRQNI